MEYSSGVSTDLTQINWTISTSNLVKDNDIIYDTPGFRVIIMTEANSSVKSALASTKVKNWRSDGLCVAYFID